VIESFFPAEFENQFLLRWQVVDSSTDLLLQLF
jgi:hypothetical protein